MPEGVHGGLPPRRQSLKRRRTRPSVHEPTSALVLEVVKDHGWIVTLPPRQWPPAQPDHRGRHGADQSGYLGTGRRRRSSVLRGTVRRGRDRLPAEHGGPGNRPLLLLRQLGQRDLCQHAPDAGVSSELVEGTPPSVGTDQPLTKLLFQRELGRNVGRMRFSTSQRRQAGHGMRGRTPQPGLRDRRRRYCRSPAPHRRRHRRAGAGVRGHRVGDPDRSRLPPRR